ncbi:CGNR zinc finger domain-containing protein [Nonomuraea africana]|uniref:RNA-binding Zn ribbon-like protein n=1 Tax=Nonomuraea africana TaxID=46171 RepID=A0ABR9KBX0_9ACTN|nr:CGNR zinc finger domain-containing protein [Nonomuraea africana]MBE1559505.1 putative RNA-binding Zn ribbon-like protein [Nonomuraea africana]
MSNLAALTGEPLALDLVNTRPSSGDLLATPDDLRAWLALQYDRLPDAREWAAELAAPDLDAVHAVRQHTADALEYARHGTRPPDADLEALSQAQRAAPAIHELIWDGSKVTALRRRTGPAGARLAACLAEAAADLLADPAVTGIRQCEADDCVMLFLPAHPRRRWCSAARCGNRARVARHYQRNKRA